MSNPLVLSILLNAHTPFAGYAKGIRTPEEQWFFQALSETYIPLLEVFDHLDRDHVPFRLAISLSPMLCQMLKDEVLLRRYLEYTDQQIEFGRKELDRTRESPGLWELARLFYDRAVDKRILFTERYGKDILNVLDHHQKQGRVELLNTAATHAFLPLYTSCPEAIQAQFEAAIASHRLFFGRTTQGFWLPELGWSGDLDRYLRAYNFSYTVVDTHGVLLGNDEPRRGSFYPVKTPSQVFILIQDFYAHRDICESERGYRFSPVFRDHYQDVGYELPADSVKAFLGPNGSRAQTGYKYWDLSGKRIRKHLYDPLKASEQARIHARSFLAARIERLARAAACMDESPISLCAYEADTFGRFWYEGPEFLETLFREAAQNGQIRFMNPAEYIFKQNVSAFQTSMPEFSSWGDNGYAETWLDASSDWMYRHVVRALDRMVELAERFPNDSGLKERALNQAAREILLVQTSDWPRMLYKRESTEYARHQIETALRNFTTIYESLGSNYISTEWLTNLERQHNLFPGINYRIFRRKH
ncbi:MAG: DUF1957 domain-containing protein [Spirochaetaceae bacterium]|jgi:1,4-alpha-glucan branching enzyme|nr:DUF1957 domain-containing protein [Spirochaetaceae bacterium]